MNDEADPAWCVYFRADEAALLRALREARVISGAVHPVERGSPRPGAILLSPRRGEWTGIWGLHPEPEEWLEEVAARSGRAALAFRPGEDGEVAVEAVLGGEWGWSYLFPQPPAGSEWPLGMDPSSVHEALGPLLPSGADAMAAALRLQEIDAQWWALMEADESAPEPEPVSDSRFVERIGEVFGIRPLGWDLLEDLEVLQEGDWESEGLPADWREFRWLSTPHLRVLTTGGLPT